MRRPRAHSLRAATTIALSLATVTVLGVSAAAVEVRTVAYCPNHPPGSSSAPVAAPAKEAGPTDSRSLTAPGKAAAPEEIDPLVFFNDLVARYRGLTTYRDCVRLTSRITRDGVEPSEERTELTCHVAEGGLKVRTPSTQTRDGLGLKLPVKQSPAMKDVQRRYDLWLAPHLSLKFQDEPLKQLREGVDEGFTATEAESVTIDNRKLVHLELKSGDGQSESSTATFDLYVNPDSMLIERIEGQQILPDGASHQTTFDITPMECNGRELGGAQPAA